MWLGTEDVLEVFVCSLVNFLCALRWADLLREQDRVLSDKVFDLILDILRDLDQHILSFWGETRMHLKLTRVLH